MARLNDALFGKILIANRGEIACRVIRTARRLGVATVAVFSDADSCARHVRLADEAIRIGSAQARESYLAIEKIIAAAKASGADAIHPGYGFLSENPAFREACDASGLVFIGPPLEALRAMGSKSEAKKLMQAAGVPLASGYHGDDQDAGRLKREAEAIGFPVLIKAALGGGGKGMRRVEASADFDAALAACRREAMASFGDAKVLIEKYIEPARHIEIQIFGDAHGNIVSLFERDCSVQRRHQKVLEEAPAPGLSAARRREMGAAAVQAAKAVAYVGAGTVEFIVAPDGAFFFMEMNTRLQVEHPVTECVTGLDLVEWQLRVAAGEPLPKRQDDIFLNGCAIEARIYAEDSGKDFLPSTGTLAALRWPARGPHVRIDAGVDQGDEIGPHYDPMIAKLIVHDDSRARALARMRRALADCHIVGVANNVVFLSRLVATPSFVAGHLDTGLIARESPKLFAPEDPPPADAIFVAALAALACERASPPRGNDPLSPWNARDNWRLSGEEPRLLNFTHADTAYVVRALARGESSSLSCGEARVTAKAEHDDNGRMRVAIDDRIFSATAISTGADWAVFLDGRMWTFQLVDPLRRAAAEHRRDGGLTAPMSGRVVAHFVEPQTSVAAGAPLMAMEAMKMEHVVKAPAAGRVASFLYAPGDQVSEGSELLTFEPEDEA
ncbi:biotin carboxylase N-terminal domain-containing protein [Rhodoblastus sp.]|uniref:acetyl/propionyl/methylcrotonyl-CoA carboxylase subunit alpha n=1 Tax=Rhodoblastus sp. TaxID=1962975 RepID=UPI002628E3FF|nr:biotin carboxylase N-terminal domain-containing protein [Rhodoblastus sp.]